MQNKIFTLTSFFLLTSFAFCFGQSVQLQKLGYQSKLYDLDNGYAFISRGKKNKDKTVPLIIEFYSKTLEKSSIQFPIAKSMGLQAITFSGQAFFTVFKDSKVKTFTYFIHDLEGNEIAKKVRTIEKSNESTPEIFPMGNGEFVQFRSIKRDKWGYIVEKLNSSLETIWTHEYLPDGKYATYTMPTVNENGIVFLRPVLNEGSEFRVGPFGSISKENFDAVILDPNSGDATGSYSLIKNGAYLEPSTLVVDNDGSVVMAGMYFNSNKDSKVKSDGVYLLKLDKEGNEQILNLAAWKESSNGLASFMNDKANPIFDNLVMSHEVTFKNDNYYLTLEAFKKASEGAVKAFNSLTGNSAEAEEVELKDFYVLTFDKEGSLINKAKAAKRAHSVPLTSGKINFDFQFMAGDGEDEGVVFIGEEKKKLIVGKYFGYFPVDSSGEEIEIKKIPFEGKGKAFDGEPRVRLYPNEPGKALLYEYYPEKYKLFLEVISF